MPRTEANGKGRKIGVSIYSPAELDAHEGAYSFDLNQAPFNLVDRRLANSGWLGRLKRQGCEVHVRSAFLQGLLLMQRNAIPKKFARWASLWDCWHAWLKQHDIKAVQACLAYPLSFSEVDRVVVGVLDLAQLQQVASAARFAPIVSLPDISCEEENLINPTKWQVT